MIPRSEAIEAIKSRFPNSVFVFSNGLTSREAAGLLGLDGSLFLLHAMGEALPVASGLASARPDLSIVVVEGDGNALMGAACWPLGIPNNVHHFILENGEFETTGGQRLPGDTVWPAFSEVISVSSGGRQLPNPPAAAAILESLSERIMNVGNNNYGV